jgi:magnesium-transporting ATPase (P-type)
MSCIAKINNKFIIYSKGAPDLLLPVCTKYLAKNGDLKTIDADFKAVLQHNLSQFAANSLSTLLICYKELS